MKRNLTKKYLKLTKEQKLRGVIFSSTLVKSNGFEGKTHEVLNSMSAETQERKIELLRKDSFFNGLYSYNLIRR